MTTTMKMVGLLVGSSCAMFFLLDKDYLMAGIAGLVVVFFMGWSLSKGSDV